jgi:hypothetical protein
MRSISSPKYHGNFRPNTWAENYYAPASDSTYSPSLGAVLKADDGRRPGAWHEHCATKPVRSAETDGNGTDAIVMV